jgi:hypothetical protein
MEIWLPPNFKESTKKAADILNTFTYVELLATEISSKASAYNMHAAVTYELMTGDSLDGQLETRFPHLAAQARVVDNKSVTVNTVPARRIVIEYRLNEVDYNDLIYVFQDGNTIWYVQYQAEISEFFSNLSMFEQSVQTFRTTR